MEIYERVRILRKHLNLSQTEFGKRLGVNRDVINNIENNRLAKADQKLSLFKLMCKEFAVSEDWLLTGAEPMFVQPDTFSLDRFITEHGATELEREIVKTYFKLPMDIRQVVMEHFRKRFLGGGEAVPAMAPVDVDTEETPEEVPYRTEEEIQEKMAAYEALLRGRVAYEEAVRDREGSAWQRLGDLDRSQRDWREGQQRKRRMRYRGLWQK